MNAEQEDVAANFANQHELTKKKSEADLRAERCTTGAGNSIGLCYHWSSLEQSDRIKDLQRLWLLPYNASILSAVES